MIDTIITIELNRIILILMDSEI